VDYRVRRAPDGTWTLNGAPVRGLEAYVDLDLAITPATNLQQLRRVPLPVGAATELPVAWLDVMAGTLAALPQRYERRAERAYWYEAPSVGYAGLLELAPTGFIRHYPGLWAAEE
jgi:hypothetical protein